MIDPDLIRAQLANVLTDATIPELPNHYRGKVRDNYDLPDGRRIIIATDRQSAFDREMAAVPFKGQVLTQTARYWFEATADVCANHVIEYPDPNVLVCRNLDMLPVEMVVRDYMTGSTNTSIWPMYERGERVMYGVTFPDGLVKNQKLPETILTPTTKAVQGEHDAPITPADIVAQGLLTQALWDELAEKSLAVFARGRELAARQGLILVDTKFEFGLAPDGTVTLADEILTPDSSRYWLADSYGERLAAGENPDGLDKEFLRLWVNARCDPYKDPIPAIPEDTLVEFSGRYIRLFETVTGRPFDAEGAGQPVIERIRANLAPYFA
ncbi:MAG: phosphoribosylaminoimidazolesuccinocarboxamide synthase [Hyphomicrobiales bacterium]|nr:phosphoribosylaminoimidazolesuccinocarboxamide synthase [Hyphomicrobiales bacterium]MCP5373300.1 phosphoribosylaminoimidazolesuccinocarboxamide synthase [Hyphomicrobiales bacterium]